MLIVSGSNLIAERNWVFPGVAANHQAWGPQLKGICGTDVPNREERAENGNHDQSSSSPIGEYAQENVGIQACALDNRGVGQSSKPEDKKHYSTETMARDALKVMDHLGWKRAHIVGHSMGGMIVCKLAVIAPERVISLAMLSTTGGGYQCLPKVDRTMIQIAYRFLRAKTPEERAHVDLDTHYTQDYLNTVVNGEYMRTKLYKEYVVHLTNSGMQPKHGLDGQFNACWTHAVASHELDRVRSHGIRVLLIHGIGDIVAQIRHARKIAEKLHPVSYMLELSGGHMITHQHTTEVNDALLAAIRGELHLMHSEYSDESLQERGWQIWQRVKAEDGSAISELSGSRYVVCCVDLINRYWPHWLSLKYLCPSVYRVLKHYFASS